MASIRSKFIRTFIVEGPMKRIINEAKTVADIRQKETAMPVPRGTSVLPTSIAGLPAEWISAANVPAGNEAAILYFHGGGFVSGSCETHRSLAANISKACGVRVLLLQYRLAPENKYPAANEDCLAAYRHLIQNGIPAAKIILAGDSAGGCLTLMTLLALRDGGEPLPAAAFFLSLLGDLIYYDGESYISKRDLDPFANGFKMIDFYIDQLPEKPPVLSPINQNLAGLPSLLIQVGDNDVLLSDSLRLAERAKTAGVETTLEVWPDMWHVFQGFGPMMPEAKRALHQIGEFVRKHLGMADGS